MFGAYVYFPSGADLQMMYINNTNSDFVFSNSISNYMQFVYYGYPNASIRLVHPLAATEKGDDGTYAKSLKAYYDRTQ